MVNSSHNLFMALMRKEPKIEIPTKNCICTKEYIPHKGEDNKIYSNKCNCHCNGNKKCVLYKKKSSCGCGK